MYNTHNCLDNEQYGWLVSSFETEERDEQQELFDARGILDHNLQGYVLRVYDLDSSDLVVLKLKLGDVIV